MGEPFSLIVRGLIGIAFGLLAIAWPGMTLAILVTIFGVYAIFDGVSILAHGVTGMHERSWASICRGLVGIAAGLVALLWPGITALAFVFLIAAWAGATGLLELVDVVRQGRSILSESALLGFMAILFGGLVFASPGAGAVVLAWLLGAYAIVCGVTLIAVGIQLRSRIAS